MKKVYILTLLVSFLCINFACEGEDGSNGTDGIDGVDGTNGSDGLDGIDGINGINGEDGENSFVYDELTQYGSISLTLEGTRTDDVSFTDTSEFKFAALLVSDAWTSENTNLVSIGDSSTSFDVIRFLSTPSEDYNNSSVDLNFVVLYPGEESETFEFNLSIDNYAIISEDSKYFVLDEVFDNTDDSLTNFAITNYSFDDQTNNFIFSFSFEVSGENNDTGNTLYVSGEVNVVVLEEYTAPEEDM